MDFQTCWDLFFLYGKVPSLPLGPYPLYGFYVGILGPLGSYPPYGRVGNGEGVEPLKRPVRVIFL